jgi:hypothetical protein
MLGLLRLALHGFLLPSSSTILKRRQPKKFLSPQHQLFRDASLCCAKRRN